MNGLIVFVGPNKRITPLEVEALKAGFVPIQVCAFDFEYEYSARKILELVNNQEYPVLFRFIYPFYDYILREKVSTHIASGVDEATATQKVFEEMVTGWQNLLSKVTVPVIEVNNLEIILKQKNKSFQYKRLMAHLNRAVPETIFLDQGEQPEQLEDLLERAGGIIYKPVCGSRSQGIVIVKKNPEGYELISDIKNKRVSQLYKGDLRKKFMQLHNPSYVVQELLRVSNTYGGRDYDIRIHIIGGRVTGSAAFVFNPERKDDDVFSLEVAAEKDPHFRFAYEEAQLLSLEASRFFGLDVSGVDLIITDTYQVKITEVNSFPGWRTQLDLNPDYDIAQEEIAYYKSRFEEKIGE